MGTKPRPVKHQPATALPWKAVVNGNELSLLTEDGNQFGVGDIDLPDYGAQEQRELIQDFEYIAHASAQYSSLVQALQATNAILATIINHPTARKGIGNLFAGAQKHQAAAEQALRDAGEET